LVIAPLRLATIAAAERPAAWLIAAALGSYAIAWRRGLRCAVARTTVMRR
jgi:hypothetical protein